MTDWRSGRTVHGHLYRDRAALALDVRRLAEVNGGVIPVNWGEHEGFADAGHFRLPGTLGLPPEDRSRRISVGETSDFQLIAALLELAGWDAD